MLTLSSYTKLPLTSQIPIKHPNKLLSTSWDTVIETVELSVQTGTVDGQYAEDCPHKFTLIKVVQLQ